MNELNNNWVLWGTLIALGLTALSFVAFVYKAARAMEGLEADEDK